MAVATRLQQSHGGVASTRRTGPEQSVAECIDDLARYNILRYLMSNRDAAGDAAFFAGQLGFHSDQQTAEDLKAMGRVGILVECQPNGSWRPSYSLTGDPATLAAVIRLLDEADSPRHDRSLLRRLADRSLRRARSRVEQWPRQHTQGELSS